MLQEVSRDRISGHLQALRAFQVVRNTVDGRTVEGVLDRGVYREVYGAGARSVFCVESLCLRNIPAAAAYCWEEVVFSRGRVKAAGDGDGLCLAVYP